MLVCALLQLLPLCEEGISSQYPPPHVLPSPCTAPSMYCPPQVTKEQYKEMIERRRAELPPPPPLPINTDAPPAAAVSEDEEEGGSPKPKLSPKERMDANW